MNNIEKQVSDIIEADFKRSGVGKVVNAFVEASKDAKFVFAFVVNPDRSVEHFSFIPSERLLLELDIFSQDARDRIVESRETIYSEIDEETTDEEDE